MQEIARNITEATAGTRDVSKNVGGVSRAAEETGAISTQVQSAANKLTEQSGLLREKVNSFLRRYAPKKSMGRKEKGMANAIPFVSNPVFLQVAGRSGYGVPSSDLPARCSAPAS